jgi:two-component system nitrate/nitrite response regulator NarL
MATPTAPATKQLLDRKVRILIADDYPSIRAAVRSILSEDPRFEVCGEADDGAKAIEQAAKLKPDAVVLNVTMPVLNGFEAAREIRATLPDTAIIILSANADHQYIEEARKIGVRAYIAKTKAAEALVKAIEVAIAGGDFVVVD